MSSLSTTKKAPVGVGFSGVPTATGVVRTGTPASSRVKLRVVVSTRTASSTVRSSTRRAAPTPWTRWGARAATPPATRPRRRRRAGPGASRTPSWPGGPTRAPARRAAYTATSAVARATVLAWRARSSAVAVSLTRRRHGRRGAERGVALLVGGAAAADREGQDYGGDAAVIRRTAITRCSSGWRGRGRRRRWGCQGRPGRRGPPDPPGRAHRS